MASDHPTLRARHYRGVLQSLFSKQDHEYVNPKGQVGLLRTVLVEHRPIA